MFSNESNIWRCRQRFFNGPSFFEALLDSANRDTAFSRPCRHALNFSVIFKIMVRPNVPHLFKMCSPSAVTWFIVSVIVNAIKGMFLGWSWSHIFDEIKQAIFAFPSITHLYASVLVKMLSCLKSPFTSPDHIVPNRVFERTSKTMCAVVGVNAFCADASARLTNAAPEITKKIFSLFSTIAATQPVTSLAAARGFSDNGKSSKSLTNKIHKFCHLINASLSALYTTWRISQSLKYNGEIWQS